MVRISNLSPLSSSRTLSEFWHWFVANIPGDSVDDGEVIFDLLFPLVLPEGDGDHRFGYFVLKQPGRIDYSAEGGPTDSCSPNMSKGRGPKRLYHTIAGTNLNYPLYIQVSEGTY